MPDGPTRQTDLDKSRRLNVRLLPLIVALLALLALWTGFRGWLILLIGFGGVWLLATLWTLSLQRSLQIERKIHLAWAGVGDSVPEQVKITNTGWFPALWVELSDSSNSLPEPLRFVSDVDAHFGRSRHFNHLFIRRGLYTLGPTHLQTGDPFGIYTLTLINRHTDTILITPPMLPLGQIGVAPGGWAGDQNRRRGALTRQISATGTRPYLPGDSLKRIHWSASAHQDSLIVRQLEAAASDDYWIFVDLDRSVQAGSGLNSTLELAVVLASSMAARGFRERRRVGLVLSGSQMIRLAPRADVAQRWRLFRALAVAEAGSRSLSDLIAAGKPARAAAIILITSATQPAWIAQLGNQLHGARATVLLINPAEFGGQPGQDKVVTALERSGIPFWRMPRALLDQAYATPVKLDLSNPDPIESGKHYFQPMPGSFQQPKTLFQDPKKQKDARWRRTD